MPGDFQGFTLPAPNGGQNLIDAIDNIPLSDALEMNNLIPMGQSVSVRGGYEEVDATGEGSQINLLAGLALASGTSKIVACAGSKIWEFSTGTAVNITGSSAPTSSNFNEAVFANRLYLCNGADVVQVYDGSTVTDSDFTGVTLSTLINVGSYHDQLYFVKKDSLEFWYGGSEAVGASALTKYDLKYFMKLGGRLLFVGSWTNQLASTSADLFFACSSEGEILFYQGLAPDDTTTPWQLVARFVIGKPMGYRAFVRVNNDIWIITEQGIVPVSALFSLDTNAALDVIGRKINPLISNYAKVIGFSHLWHGVHYPQLRRVILAIPRGDNGVLLLHYQTDAKAWGPCSLYQDSDCVSTAVVAGLLYYGSSNGTVFLGESGYNDNGNPISISTRLGFSFFGNRGTFKAFKDLRPLLKTRRGLQLQVGIDTDFKRVANLNTITTNSGVFTPYGSLYGSLYSSSVDYIYDRFSLKGQGHCGAVRIEGSIKDTPLEIFGFEVRFEAGGQV